jgi:hypothetical protein
MVVLAGRRSSCIPCGRATALAVTTYNMSFLCMRRAGDMDTAARANYRMGMLSHEQGKWQDAMFYLRR